MLTKKPYLYNNFVITDEKRFYTLTYKFSKWRSYVVKRFFPEIRHNVQTIEEALNLAEKGVEVKLLVWGVSLEEEGIELNHPLIKVLRLEDGFIRSVGLGIRLTPPISLVADSRGIYYNSQKPSDLEYILSTYKFDQEIRERARNIVNKLINLGITKYNLQEKPWIPPKTTKKILVVAGQVETDMSIKYGSPVIKTNLELLRKVRENNPEEYIVYKPHPDVSKGYRKGYYDKKTLLEFCDEVCEGCSSLELIKYGDEIHVISSLFGFEALLRGKKVVCYGQPFYSGWGLTEDIYPNERRKRKLSLDELVAGALILYPMYVSLKNGNKISPEEAIEEIKELRTKLPLKWRLWSIIQLFLDPLLKIRRF